VRRKLWSNPGNPPDGVAADLGISREKFGERLHKIKRAAGLKPRDRVTLWSDGDITFDTDNEPIGNVQDED
jgi:hypothetical protein